jgi:hypothetical protein
VGEQGPGDLKKRAAVRYAASACPLKRQFFFKKTNFEMSKEQQGGGEGGAGPRRSKPKGSKGRNQSKGSKGHARLVALVLLGERVPCGLGGGEVTVGTRVGGRIRSVTAARPRASVFCSLFFGVWSLEFGVESQEDTWRGKGR